MISPTATPRRLPRLIPPEPVTYAERMLPFAKYSGAGNDFVLLDEDSAAGLEPGRLARRICPRATGVGVDGLVLVGRERANGHPVRFFNPDGSEFSTCGNGSRCAARYVVDQGWAEGPGVDLRTRAGTVRASVSGEVVDLRYRIPVRLGRRLTVEFAGEAREGTLVEIGTPHFVVPLPRLPRGGIEELCRPIRHHEAFEPDGANVDLVQLADRGHGRIRTFERGVEGETLACGSGAMASTLALRAAGEAGPELSLETRSGATLVVTLEGRAADGELPEEQEEPVRVRLSGPARRLFEGRFPRDEEDAPATPRGASPGDGSG